MNDPKEVRIVSTYYSGSPPPPDVVMTIAANSDGLTSEKAMSAGQSVARLLDESVISGDHFVDNQLQ